MDNLHSPFLFVSLGHFSKIVFNRVSQPKFRECSPNLLRVSASKNHGFIIMAHDDLCMLISGRRIGDFKLLDSFV